MPGHDLGHTPPVGLSWGTYLDHFVQECGGWAALADELVHRAAAASLSTSMDLQTIEKGLRRLSVREHKPAGQYGRWMLRLFGIPPVVENWGRRLAQYHSRFADLPTSLRLEQLRLWDRPPISNSQVAPWIHVGLASVFHRMNDLKACGRQLSQAEKGSERAGPMALMEIKLLQARLATDGKDRRFAGQLLDDVEDLLLHNDIPREDGLCYRARLVGQRGYHLTKPLPGDLPDFVTAREMFDALEEDPAAPFACFRKNTGLAYCTWRLGDSEEGARLAGLAAEYAGDGGLVRFRIMALNMLSLMVAPEDGRRINERANRLAGQLEDEDLLQRVAIRTRKLKSLSGSTGINSRKKTSS